MQRLNLKNNLLIACFAATLVGNAFAENNDIQAPDGFNLVETKQLDKAWVNPDFKPSDFKTIAVKMDKFDFRPGQKKFKVRGRNENYELTEKEKNRLEEKTEAIFKKQLGLLENYQLVELDKANEQTIIVQIKLNDFVNKVPNMRQVDGITKLYMRQFGAATLDIEFLGGDDQHLLFKGYVREEIEPMGHDLERANTITARQQTKLQLERWAKDLRKHIDAL
ncbi:hypothetical protein [uncultured Paraglaciecola sp.]|uniref:hypothetical protein n=1 Tax=uncultured Paraglaciecola sp. TaxID=1765024 RepID=UPI00259866AC|nr:hypothetical protein [uncultured Paraglaciecola sp.]